jgi:hypothetical protein
MTTSRTTSRLAKPTDDKKITLGTFSYLRTRNKFRVFNLLHDAFERSGLTQVALARRLGLGTDRVCKLLGSPANLTLDTLSDLFFAMEGAEVAYSLSPLFESGLEEQPKTRTSSTFRLVDWHPQQREAA